ncbi:MAG TPA: hypothetical protein VLK65_02855, partial [Vicinamibacteria bacterium]|nr:hypothetical protein [Vicinamibacteria bacterium]
AKGKAGLELRASMFRRIVESGLNEARTFQLVNVVETYFKLSGEQAESFRQLLSRKGYREVEEMELTWADEMMEKGRRRGLAEGIEKGREEGLREGKRKTLVQKLRAKFGALPLKTVSRIEGLESVDELDRYLERVLTAGSLEEMEI